LGENCIIKKLVNSLEQNKENADANAAVVVLLKETPQDLQVLFVKRAESPKDAWSGQIALPGGKRDPKDFEIKTTVVRETLEETGINLLDGYRFLGTMEPLRSVRKPGFKIVPFVVLQETEQTIKLNEELTEYFWTPLTYLAGQEKTVIMDQKEVPAYTVNNQFIWGLTYNIINNLLSLLTEDKKEN
jgi:8-oxo-dGTP pyrophosphatase MutT (NUDIX family)